MNRCLAIARAGQVDLIVGLGGESAMDTAKGCNFLITNGGRVQDYAGPAVVRFNARDPENRLAYAELASMPEIACVSEGLDQAVDALCARLEALLNGAGIARSLGSLGADPKWIPTLAEEAARQWTAAFNPRPVAADEFAALYEETFEARGDGESHGYSRRAGGIQREPVGAPT